MRVFVASIRGYPTDLAGGQAFIASHTEEHWSGRKVQASARQQGICLPMWSAGWKFGTYPPAEIAARFHHRLVEIHLFANGNGRHARLATDLLCQRQGWPISMWGASDLVQDGEVRRRYIQSLQSADARDFVPLIGFMNLNFTD